MHACDDAFVVLVGVSGRVWLRVWMRVCGCVCVCLCACLGACLWVYV